MSNRPILDSLTDEEQAEVWFETVIVLGYIFKVPSDKLADYVDLARQIVQLRRENKENEINQIMLSLRRP